MKISNRYVELLNTKGVSLQTLGIRDTGLERSEALFAIEFLKEDSIPNFGRRRLPPNGADIEPSYANWHCDPKPGERKEYYFTRSWLTAQDYIKKYPEPVNGKPLFGIVIGE
jgi:hypothetical protein